MILWALAPGIPEKASAIATTATINTAWVELPFVQLSRMPASSGELASGLPSSDAPLACYLVSGQVSSNLYTDQQDISCLSRSVQNKTEALGVSLTTQMACQDTKTDPLTLCPDQNWHAGQALQFSVTGNLLLFGQFDAGCDSMATQDTRVASRSGLAWKVPGCPIGEVQIRGGPSMNVDDSCRPDHAQEHSELLFELQGKWPLINQVSLQYSGSAVPAIHATDKEHFNQDLLVALPIGHGGELKLGAKHNWEGPADARPLVEGVQLYLGVTLKR
jgi:hypothetical protein